MSANIDAMVREGIAAAKSGDKEAARKLLSKAVELDAYNEQAWIWLSGVVETPEDQRVCLENALTINPANDRARKGLAYLDGKQVDFSPPPPPKPAAPPRDIPTSVEWDTGTAATPPAAPNWQPGGDISEEEYDSWVTGLNISTGDASPTAPPVSSSPFAGDPDDDIFSAGPFSSPSLDPDFSPPATNNPPRRSSFEFSKPMPVVSGASDAPTFGDFGTDFGGSDGSGFDSDDPFADVAPAKPSRREQREAKQAEKEAAKSSKEAAKQASKQAAQDKKNSQNAKSGKAGDKQTGDIFMPKAPARDYTLMDDIDADQDNRFLEDSEGEGELFGHIPKGIKPTRLPGTKEKLPFIGVLLMLLLILLNIGAVAMIVVQILPIINA